MQLEDYFDFLAEDDIRLKGHRIGIETILFDYRDGLTAEEIVLRYPSVALEAVYATITYYLHNRARLDAYLRAAEQHEADMRREQDRHPSRAVKRLRELAEARYRAGPDSTRSAS
jgi:uncharacterized protein (DUF433 family)